MTVMRKRILIVDDDEDILDLLRYNLSHSGFDVETASNSDEAVRKARAFLPALIVMDITMPGNNGIELCRMLRSRPDFSETYVFLLTGSAIRFSDDAFRSGADDYIEKMNGLKCLMERIAAVLKSDFVIRKRVMQIALGPLKLDRNAGTAVFRQKQVDLTGLEFEVLFFLLQNAGREVAARQLIAIISGSDVFLAEPEVSWCIRSIHRKLHYPLIRESAGGRYRLDLSAR